MSSPLIHRARTRSVLRPTHLLHTPESFVRTPMPGLANGLAVVHASPDLGARFLCFTAELEPGGTLAASAHNRFLYVLGGQGSLVGDDRPGQALSPDGFAFVEPFEQAVLRAHTAMRCVVIDKRFEPLPDGHPANPTRASCHLGSETDVPPVPLGGDHNLQVRSLMPPGLEYDFAVNTMTYAPGAGLVQVEVHYMEHGLLMLEGEGLYLLGGEWYPVQAGDFIWMAPYCPQWFAATGTVPARYLIYKNFNRMPSL